MKNDINYIKHFLSRGLWLDKQIISNMSEIKRLRETAIPGRAISGMPSNPNKSGSYVEHVAIAIAELERENARLFREKEQIAKAIESICRDQSLSTNQIGKYTLILRYRYMHGWTWPVIAEHIGYSKDYVRALHREALKHITLPRKDNRKSP